MTRACDREDYDPGIQPITLRQAINRIKKIFPNDKVQIDKCYHYISGFITLQDGRILYVSSRDERYEADVYKRMLVRSAESTTDYTGGRNNYFDLFKESREKIISKAYWR